MPRRPGRNGLRAWAAAGWLLAAACPRPAAAHEAAAVADAPRRALLAGAEAALARGDTAAALSGFERAAAMAHSADTEMGLVRTQLQQGQYRQALAFAAHTAGGHTEAPAASALYAWLLAVGGQPAAASRLLDQARAASPDDALLKQVQALLATPGARPGPDLLAPPHRLAPEAVALGAEAPPPTARIAASGVLLAGGRHALLPLSAVPDRDAPLWLRNGLGQTTQAVVERRLGTLGLALATLDPPLPGGATATAPHEPFAGSAGQVVAYPAADDALPAWPWLHAGFIGAGRLGIDVPAAAQGAPVFDAMGRWTGIAMPSPQGFTLLSVQRLQPLLDDPFAVGADVAGQRLGPAEVYERALRIALQVIVALR